MNSHWREFSAPAWPLFNITGCFNSWVWCPATLPSHTQVDGGAKALLLIEVSRLMGTFIGVSDSFLLGSEDKARISPGDSALSTAPRPHRKR